MITRLKDRVQISMISRSVLVQVLCGHDVQMNMYIFYILSESPPLNKHYTALFEC